MIRPFKHDEIKQIWPHIRGYINASLEHDPDGMTELEIFHRLEGGDLQAAAITDAELYTTAVFVLEFLQRDDGEMFINVELASGKNSDWVDELDEFLSAVGRNWGAKAILIKGREGWARRLRHLGFKHQYTILRKEL